jgi:hypothetical protein
MHIRDYVAKQMDVVWPGRVDAKSPPPALANRQKVFLGEGSLFPAKVTRWKLHSGAGRVLTV